MNDYSAAMKVYLDQPERSQKGLAEAVGTSQPTIGRYASGERIPENIEIARQIDAATEGAVPLALWQRVMMARLGIEAAEAA